LIKIYIQNLSSFISKKRSMILKYNRIAERNLNLCFSYYLFINPCTRSWKILKILKISYNTWFDQNIILANILLFSSIIPNVFRDANISWYIFLLPADLQLWWLYIWLCMPMYAWLCGSILTSSSDRARAISLLITSCILHIPALLPISVASTYLTLSTISFTSAILNLSFFSNHQHFAAITTDVIAIAIINILFFYILFFYMALSATILKFNNELFIIGCKSRQPNIQTLIHGNSFFFPFLSTLSIFFAILDSLINLFVIRYLNSSYQSA